MGTAWQYKAAHESYRSGTELIQILIETRAKGGNLLLNVGPKPDGELPIEQEERLRQIALWHFAFGEAIHEVRPWVVTNEGDLWFTRKKDEDTVYVFIEKQPPWSTGERRRFTLRTVRARPDAKVSVLGASSEILEYHPEADPRPRWTQDAAGLHLDVMMAQRLHNDHKWQDPVVLKITHVEPALKVPAVVTAGAAAPAAGTLTLDGELRSLGDATTVQVGFQYRREKGVEELLNKEAPWQDTPLQPRTTPGRFSAQVRGVAAGVSYQFRAVVKHPLITLYGEEKTLPSK
jgi:alpha-L-fucosidase